MYRHVFIGGFKEGTTEERMQEAIAFHATFKSHIPSMVDQSVGRNIDFGASYSPRMQMISVMDFKDKAGCDEFMKDTYHLGFGEIFKDCLDPSTWTVVDYEF